MLEVINLECARGDRPLIQGLSFQLHPGDVLHIRGRNGSGKTTLLRSLCGLSTPVAGEIRWHGRGLAEWGAEFRRELCYVGHQDAVQGELTAVENLRHYAGLLGLAVSVQHVAGVLAAMELDAADLPAKFLSQGQRRRVALARLLLAPRALWILDEPLTSLDVDSVATVSALIAEHARKGGMVALTSHQDIRTDGARALTLAT